MKKLVSPLSSAWPRLMLAFCMCTQGAFAIEWAILPVRIEGQLHSRTGPLLSRDRAKNGRDLARVMFVYLQTYLHPPLLEPGFIEPLLDQNHIIPQGKVSAAQLQLFANRADVDQVLISRLRIQGNTYL